MIFGETEQIAFALTKAAPFQITTPKYTVYDAGGTIAQTGNAAVYNAGTTEQELQFLFTPAAVGRYQVVYEVTLSDGQKQVFGQAITVTEGPPDGGDYSDIYAATRFALTGDPDSATPDARILDFAIAESLLTMRRDYPCTNDPANRQGDNLLLYNKAVGLAAALLLLNTPSAGEYARTLVKVKIGPVEETMTEGVAIESAKTWLLSEFYNAAGSIACVMEYRASLPVRPVLVLAGRRRAIEGGRCGSNLYNGNRGGW